MIKRTQIVKKSCKCGCGKPPTIGSRGWNFLCLPKIEQIEKTNKHYKQKALAAKRAVSRKGLHSVQKEVKLPPGALKSAFRQKPIAKLSKSMIANLKIYAPAKKSYLKAHPICEANLENCTKVSTDIHHKAGRIGKLLYATAYFLCVCRNCHRFIEENPIFAKEKGLSVSRLN